MRTIEFTGQFKRDYKRESKGAHKKTLAKDLSDALNLLRAGKKLPKKYYDHPLVGIYWGCMFINLDYLSSSVYWLIEF